MGDSIAAGFGAGAATAGAGDVTCPGTAVVAPVVAAGGAAVGATDAGFGSVFTFGKVVWVGGTAIAAAGAGVAEGAVITGAVSGANPSFDGTWMAISCGLALIFLGSESKIIGKKTIAKRPIVNAPMMRRRPRRLSSSSVADRVTVFDGAADF